MRRNGHRRALPVSRALTLGGAADVRGFDGGGEVSPLLLWGSVGLVGLAFLLSMRKGSIMTQASGLFGKAFDFAKGTAFKLALPSNVGRYAEQMIIAGKKFNVDPWVLAGIMYGESLGGDALTPPGPGGTGDFIPRGSGSAYAKYANPSTGLPPDGKGWGRGLMQIDYGVHNAWFVGGANWADPQTIIDKAASIFAEHLAFFSAKPGPGVSIECWRLTTGMPQYGIAPWRTKYPGIGLPVCSAGSSVVGPFPDPRPLTGAKLYEAALASYNAGTKGVLQAVALGLPAEAPTATQSYVSKFLGRVGTWSAKF